MTSEVVAADLYLPAADDAARHDLAASAAHAKKMYDRISELAKIGVWECDLATEELSWTDAVYDLFDLPRGSAVDRAETVKLYEEKSRRLMEQARREAIRSGCGFQLDVRIRTAKGNDRWIRITAEIEKDHGKSVRIFGTKQNITAERAIQDEVRSLQTELIHVSRTSAMEAMASTLAHEVNQPLAAASNYMATAVRMAESGTITPELTHCIQTAMKLLMRAGDTIHRLRDDTERTLITKSEIDLEQVVRDAIAVATAGHPQVTVSVAGDSSVRVAADAIQVQQVLINLLCNAREAHEGGACTITIRTVVGATHVEVCVEDAGPGIPEDILPRIFESSATTKTKGLGIGLSISRTIIEAHGGRIKAANRPEGGASVCFTLPLFAVDPPLLGEPDPAWSQRTWHRPVR